MIDRCSMLLKVVRSIVTYLLLVGFTEHWTMLQPFRA